MLAALLGVLLLCSGCGMEEDPYRVDTVVRIPVDPTEAPAATETAEPVETEAPMEESTEEPTEAPTEAPTEEPEQAPEATEAPKKTSSGGSKGSSNKNNSTNKGSSSKETEPKETKPAPTEAPATEPEVTEPPETEPEDTLYDISGYSVNSLGYGIRDEINALRTAEGISELELSSRLSAIASCRGYELSQVWSHTRPDGRGYATVLEDYGYGAGAVTELLVYVSGSGDAASIVAKWAESDSHRGSMLSESYSTVGIGTYRANGYTYVCVLLVG